MLTGDTNDVAKYIRWASSAFNQGELLALILLDSYYSEFAYDSLKRLVDDYQ